MFLGFSDNFGLNSSADESSCSSSPLFLSSSSTKCPVPTNCYTAAIFWLLDCRLGNIRDSENTTVDWEPLMCISH